MLGHFPITYIQTTSTISITTASGTSIAPIILVGSIESAILPLETDEEREEREWDAIVAQPRVKSALRRLAAEAMRQDAEGETEEGGFAVSALTKNTTTSFSIWETELPSTKGEAQKEMTQKPQD